MTATCKICHDWKPNRFGDVAVRYSARANAHFDCFLRKHGREGFLKLRRYTQEKFPWKLVLEYKLEDIFA